MYEREILTDGLLEILELLFDETAEAAASEVVPRELFASEVLGSEAL